MGVLARAVERGKKSLPSLAHLLHQARVGARLAGSSRAVALHDWREQGLAFGERWPRVDTADEHDGANPLRAFFEARRAGRGIWKWDHYFDLYDRHLGRFRGRDDVHVLEIGVYSGGSLEMWRDYFGPGCHLYGVDIEESCRQYEGDGTRIFIGDQGDREFWKRFRADVPELDVVIDDGAHKAPYQVATLEELLPHLRPGGVFLCEDVHGSVNYFGAYVTGLVQAFNTAEITVDETNPERSLVTRASGFQALVDSVHWYPFAVAVELRSRPMPELVAAKRGTQWEPFFD